MEIRNCSAFTLVELVVVIVIIGVLSVVSIPIYRGYVYKAMITEAKAVIGCIITAEKGYYAENGTFYKRATSTSVEKDDVLSISAEGNKWFRAIAIRNSTDYSGAVEMTSSYPQEELEVFAYLWDDANKTDKLPKWVIKGKKGCGSQPIHHIEW
jgi:prepilin-type N-terminal cleavage/methylation domain-containing protein